MWWGRGRKPAGSARRPEISLGSRVPFQFRFCLVSVWFQFCSFANFDHWSIFVKEMDMYMHLGIGLTRLDALAAFLRASSPSHGPMLY